MLKTGLLPGEFPTGTTGVRLEKTGFGRVVRSHRKTPRQSARALHIADKFSSSFCFPSLENTETLLTEASTPLTEPPDLLLEASALTEKR